MAELDMNLLYEEVWKQSRTSAFKYHLSYQDQEDLVQEVMMWLFEKKKPEDLAWARKQIKNYLIDLCRKYERRTGGIRSTDYDDPCGQKFVESNCVNPSYQADDFNRFLVNENLDLLVSIIREIDESGKTQTEKYIKIKLYLNENMDYFREDYESYFSCISDEDKQRINSYSKNEYTDDIIAKVFLGFKGGTNSGSMRIIKQVLAKVKCQFAERMSFVLG